MIRRQHGQGHSPQHQFYHFWPILLTHEFDYPYWKFELNDQKKQIVIDFKCHLDINLRQFIQSVTFRMNTISVCCCSSNRFCYIYIYIYWLAHKIRWDRARMRCTCPIRVFDRESGLAGARLEMSLVTKLLHMRNKSAW